MNYLYVFIAGAIVGAIIMYFVKRKNPTLAESAAKKADEAVDKIKEKVK